MRKLLTRYIQRKDSYGLETVDEFQQTNDQTLREFIRYLREMLTEYRLSDRTAVFYSSSRPCRDWK